MLLVGHRLCNEGEQARFGLDEDAAGHQALQLRAGAFGVPRLGAEAERLADVLGAESAPGLLHCGQDLAVSGRQRLRKRDAILGSQFHHGLAGDLQTLQGVFGSGELFGEPGDLVTQPFGCFADELLPGLDLVQEFPHRRSRRLKVLDARVAGRARSGWRRG